jgi:hypothetical protein
MGQRPNMRTGAKPRLEWRTIAITSPDPVEYARSMQMTLQELSDNGFNVLSMTQRGAAQIILANRQLGPEPHPPGPIPGPTLPPPPPAPTPQLARRPTSDLVHQNSEEQFVYHYLSPAGPKDQRFTSLVEALRIIRSHVDGDGTHVPGYLVAMSVTTFETPALGALLRAYAEIIASQPPKQVD